MPRQKHQTGAGESFRLFDPRNDLSARQYSNQLIQIDGIALDDRI